MPAAVIIVEHIRHILFIAELFLLALYKARNASAILDENQKPGEQIYVSDDRIVNAHDRNKAHDKHRTKRRQRYVSREYIHNDKHDYAGKGDLAADEECSDRDGKQAVLTVEAIKYRKIRAEDNAEKRKRAADFRLVNDEHEQAAQQHRNNDLYRLDEHNDADAFPSMALQKTRYSGVIATVIENILVKINMRGQDRCAEAAEGISDYYSNCKQ